MYSKIIDLVSTYLVYRGEALLGSSKSAPVWRIRRTLIDANGVEVTVAASDSFSQVWENRYVLFYGDKKCPHLP